MPVKVQSIFQPQQASQTPKQRRDQWDLPVSVQLIQLAMEAIVSRLQLWEICYSLNEVV